VLQKRHRPLHKKTSGLSFDTAMYPHEYIPPCINSGFLFVDDDDPRQLESPSS
jgi:hypothetical protein